MITFGITGSICCGKSSVTKTFRFHGIPIIDADIVARQVVEPGTLGLALIVRTFGSDYLNEDGTLNRSKLGDLVWYMPSAMEQLNTIMKPLIGAENARQIAKYHAQGYPLVGMDGALIIEYGNSKKYRPLIVVECSKATQVERLMSRNGLTEAEALVRISAQLESTQKVFHADYIINTNGTIENSINQTKRIITSLYARLYKQQLDNGEISYRKIPWIFQDILDIGIAED